MTKPGNLVVVLLLLLSAQSNTVSGQSDLNAKQENIVRTRPSSSCWTKNGKAPISDADDLSCRISTKADESCTDKASKVKIFHDQIKFRKLQLLNIEVEKGGPNKTFCLPLFIDMPNIERLTIESDFLSGPGTKLFGTDTFIEMLRDINTLNKFGFECIEFESIRDFLTKGLNLNIEELSIKSTKIHSLPEDMLKDLTMLKVLNFDNNWITSIPEIFFASNNQLEKVVLNGNHFKVLPERLLENLENLKIFHYDNTLPSHLEFDFKSIDRNSEPTILSKNIFKSNRKLKEVRFDGNFISSSIPEEIFSHNQELEDISICHTEITKLPENLLKGLNSLKGVSFFRSQINSVPENFFAHNEKLEKIDFMGNKISQVPTTLLNGLGPSLKFFNLMSNPIKFIPDSFFSQNAQLKEKIKMGKPWYERSRQE